MTRLFLVGDGDTLDALAELCGRLGYDAINRSDDPPRSVDGDDQVVVECRDPARARAVLAKVLEAGEAGYVGLLSPEREALVALLKLSADRVPKARLDRVAAPAGLPIHAVTVDEVAVAVAAQLVQARRAPPAPSSGGGPPPRASA